MFLESACASSKLFVVIRAADEIRNICYEKKNFAAYNTRKSV